MKPSRRLEKIPPYLFAELERKIAAKKAAGVDVISLGIGDPDTPTYPPIVAAAQQAVADPSTHTYPSNRGLLAFRQAIAAFYERRFGVTLDPETEVMAAIGAKECIFNLNLAFLDPDDVALAADPGYPVYTGGPLLTGAALAPDAARPGARLCARPERDPGGRARAGAPDVLQLPEQPDRRGRAGRLLRGGGRARRRATTSSPSTTTRTARRPTTATSLRRSSPRRGPRTSASRCSRCRRATT